MNIVLLHGSWHGAWCWYKVIPLLEQAGHRVHVPDLPAHGRDWRVFRGRVTLAMMRDRVCRLLDTLDTPPLLVAHSRAGIVASAVAETCPRSLAGVAYLAAYLLGPGERVVDWFGQDLESLIQGNVHIDRLALTDMLMERAYVDALYADCPQADIALARRLLTPEPSLPALTRMRLSKANYGSVRRHYIELTQDRAISLTLQRKMLARMPCETVTSIDASHSAYFSCPGRLAQVIGDLASGCDAAQSQSREAA